MERDNEQSLTGFIIKAFKRINKGPDGAESGEFCRGAKPPGPRSRHFSVIFAQNLDFVNTDVVQIQPSRKVVLETLVCPYKAT